ncbi:cell division transport system permease protein [Marivirga sericea]|uniref:Cell division protein FtsX n=1 Tax=Marivirga sericea TaxID=1028 RepID=A0A1X7IQN1_9BACT|nr:ABC transporter permease [Marivirga sericea]SMG17263.1 cell division transport system permease protein [Marivirga sericea]
MSKEKKYRKKKKLGHYPFVSVILSMTLALFILGLFALLITTTTSLTKVIQQNVEMQVYLKSNLSEPQQLRVSKSLVSKEYVLKEESIESIRFISKNEAAEKFIEETGEDFMQFLGDNPLKDAYIVKISPEYHSSEKMKEVQQDIENLNGVFEVIYTNNMVQSINENITKISIVLLAISILLFIVIGILINNTIKLALFSQRFLIRSMQLVGATKGFIRKPFIYRSIWHGIISAIVAASLLFGLLTYGSEKLEGLAELQNQQMLLIIFGGLIVTGISIASFSTFRAMQKYMAMSLDELY